MNDWIAAGSHPEYFLTAQEYDVAQILKWGISYRFSIKKWHTLALSLSCICDDLIVTKLETTGYITMILNYLKFLCSGLILPAALNSGKV